MPLLEFLWVTSDYVMTSASFKIILLHSMIYKKSETPVHAY